MDADSNFFLLNNKSSNLFRLAICPLKIIISQTPLQQWLSMLVLRHSNGQGGMSDIYQDGPLGDSLYGTDSTVIYTLFVPHPSSSFKTNKMSGERPAIWGNENQQQRENTVRGTRRSLGAGQGAQAAPPAQDCLLPHLLWHENSKALLVRHSRWVFVTFIWTYSLTEKQARTYLSKCLIQQTKSKSETSEGRLDSRESLPSV